MAGAMMVKLRTDKLRVCADCAEVFGVLTDDDGAPRFEQPTQGKCDNDCAAWHLPQSTLPRPPGDFPAAVELCYCCAAELIPSGSKFSSFYCDACREAVKRLNASVGFVALPLGRHSLMNRIVLGGDAAQQRTTSAPGADAKPDDEIESEQLPRSRGCTGEDMRRGRETTGTGAELIGAIEVFAAGAIGLFSRIDRLHDWRQIVVRDRIAPREGQSPHVPVGEYLAIAAAGPSKEEMLRQLCRYFGLALTAPLPDRADG